MTAVDLSPRTRRVLVSSLRTGHTVMESYEHPAQITRIARKVGRSNVVTIWCRYLWQASAESEWELGVFDLDALIEKAMR